MERNIGVNEETLAFDLFKKVGPGGNFLSQKHTLKWFQIEEYIPSAVIDKVSKSRWERTGSKNALQRAKEHVDKILKEHYPKPLSSDVERKLDSFMKEILKKQK